MQKDASPRSNRVNAPFLRLWRYELPSGPGADDPTALTVASAASAPQKSAGHPSVLKAASYLAAANFVAIASGLITGPLVARVLEPEGRGLLAAIVAPLALASQFGQLSVGEYATQRVARGKSPGTVFASLLPLVLFSGFLSAIILAALSGTLASGEPTVRRYLLIGAALLPIGLLAPLITGIASGRHRWGISASAQAAGPITYTAGVIVLAVAGDLTVNSAALLTVFSGFTGLLVFLSAALRNRSRMRIEVDLLRGGISYGARALPGVVAVFSNGRLDQILMLSLAGSKELGLYAVAVTYATMTSALISAVGVAITPSVAAGNQALIARTCRMALAATLICSSLAAIASYPMFLLLFGPDFVAAEGMALVLLLAQLPASGSLVIGLGLRSMGRPGIVSLADVLGLIITVPALFVLLPLLGGIGAAFVSLVSYTVVFATLLIIVSRRTKLPVSAFVAVRRTDLVEATQRLVGVVEKLLSRLPSRH